MQLAWALPVPRLVDSGLETQWATSGCHTRMRVKVPPGCLLVQAGKQLEHLTGGHVRAGFHEVVRSLAVPVPTPSPAPALEPAPAPEPASADVTALTCRESGAVERGYIVTVLATTVAAADHGLVCCDGTQVLTDATREAAAKAKVYTAVTPLLAHARPAVPCLSMRACLGCRLH